MKEATKTLIESISALKDKEERHKRGLFVVEGYNTIKDLIEFVPEFFIVAHERIDEYILPITSAEIYTLPLSRFNKLSSTVTPQGIIGVYRIPNMNIKKPQGRALVLDGISDPGNLGTIIRTAVATGYKDIYLVNSADAYSSKAVRASMGGVFKARLSNCTADECIECLKSAGYTILALDMNGKSIYDLEYIEKLALVVGSEAHGISDKFINSSDITICLPMDNDMESLNAGVAAGIAMYLCNKQN